MSLKQCDVMSFLASSQPEKARYFYCDLLGLKLEEENPSALVLRLANGSLRIQKVQSFTPHPFTALGWQVDDIEATMKQLEKAGIKFERFEGMKQDSMGIWLSPSQARISWFKDPDQNVLSLTQFPK